MKGPLGKISQKSRRLLVNMVKDADDDLWWDVIDQVEDVLRPTLGTVDASKYTGFLVGAGVLLEDIPKALREALDQADSEESIRRRATGLDEYQAVAHSCEEAVCPDCGELFKHRPESGQWPGDDPRNQVAKEE